VKPFFSPSFVRAIQQLPKIFSLCEQHAFEIRFTSREKAPHKDGRFL
jgi:hypothetical protein